MINSALERSTRYLSDEIGNAYTEWKPGQVVLIIAPTGSGKTHFILHELLTWIIRTNNESHGRILYLVNRKVLKTQLEEIIHREVQYNYYISPRPINVSEYITITTYQSIEQQIANDFSGSALAKQLQGYSHIIYDECHYFISDSIYNTSTILSFDKLTFLFDNAVQIFMSATIQALEPYIDAKYNCIQREIMQVKNGQISAYRLTNQVPPVEKITFQANYNFIRLHGFDDENDLADLLLTKKSTEKWLIFVDSISKGKQLASTLIKSGIDEDNVVFIDAQYSDNEDATSSIDEIVKKKSISKQIVICTSVLDNGISFHDENLRNIVILTDSEEEFIQMLGRKRHDGNPVDLYICKRDITFFKRRLAAVEKTLNHHKIYSQMIKNAYPGTLIDPVRYNNPVNAQINQFGQQQFLAALLNSENLLHQIKRFIYISHGRVEISLFSMNRLSSMSRFYQQMIDRIESDNNAFLKEQAKWVGLSFNDIELFIREDSEESWNRHLNAVNSAIEEKLNGPFEEDQNIALKKAIKPHLLALKNLGAEIGDLDFNDIKKATQPLSDDRFNRVISGVLQLHYRMTMKKKSKKEHSPKMYNITKISE